MIATNNQSLESMQNRVKRHNILNTKSRRKEKRNKGDKIYKVRVAESLPELNQDNKSGERSAVNAQKGKFLKSTLRYIIGKFEDNKEKENIKTSQRKNTDYLQRT